MHHHGGIGKATTNLCIESLTVRVGDKRAVDVIDRFETRFNDLEAKLGHLVEEGDKRAAGFAGLGFLKPPLGVDCQYSCCLGMHPQQYE